MEEERGGALLPFFQKHKLFSFLLQYLTSCKGRHLEMSKMLSWCESCFHPHLAVIDPVDYYKFLLFSFKSFSP